MIGFYGRVTPGDETDANAPMSFVDSFECPVLGLFGGADRSIGRGDVEAFGHALDEAGVPNALVVYDGAPHSFFDRTFKEHQAACEDAWRRALGFIRTGDPSKAA